MKYIIEAKVPITEQAWGIPFINGIGHTDNSALADKLKAKGYTVTEESSEAAFTKMKKAELVEYAESNSIDILECKTNAEIIAVLEAATAKQQELSSENK